MIGAHVRLPVAAVVALLSLIGCIATPCAEAALPDRDAIAISAAESNFEEFITVVFIKINFF
jgi:hypothetical protein